MLTQTLTMCLKCAVVLAAMLYAVSGQLDERIGVKSLLDDYEMGGIYGRPVMNMSVPVNVKVVFALLQIISFDQHSQYLTLSGRTILQWDDDYLKWDADPDEYSIPADKIWTPDLHILNSVDKPVDIHPNVLTVTSSGHVTWVRSQRLSLSCATDEDKTEPSCEIVLSSFTLGANQMSLSAGQSRIDAGYYVPSNAWELSKTKVAVGTRSYHIILGDKEFTDITYTFTLKRRPQKDDDEDKNKDDGAGALQGTCWAAVLAVLLAVHINM